MRLAILLLLAAAATGVAGPVGTYLGLAVGKTETGLPAVAYFIRHGNSNCRLVKAR